MIEFIVEFVVAIIVLAFVVCWAGIAVYAVIRFIGDNAKLIRDGHWWAGGPPKPKMSDAERQLRNQLTFYVNELGWSLRSAEVEEHVQTYLSQLRTVEPDNPLLDDWRDMIVVPVERL